MDIEQLLNEWEKDSQMNLAEPGRESIRIPSLHAKYLRVLSNSRLKLKQAKNEYAEMKNTKWNYYCGHYNTDKAMLEKLKVEPFKFILKQDMNIYLDSDKDLMQLSNKISYYEEMVAASTQMILSLKNRTWEIKSYIDFLKFQEGN